MGKLLALLGVVWGLLACSSSSNPTAPTSFAMDPTQKMFGKSNAEWSAEWWQWIFKETDCKEQILTDPTGAWGAQNQDPSSPVFFLAGTEGVTAVRKDCPVPSGKALYFPIYNLEVDNAAPTPNHYTDAQLTMQALAVYDGVILADTGAEFDGQTLGDLTAYAIKPPFAFSYTLPPPPNLYTCNGANITGKWAAYGAGYYVMIAAPSSGAHTLHIFAKAKGTPEFTLDVTYDFTIK